MLRTIISIGVLILVGAASVVRGEEDKTQWIDVGPGCTAFAAHPAANLKASWSGACDHGLAEGEGVLTWSDGNRYEGPVHGGIANGKGRYFWANGAWFEGEFKDGHREGIGTQHFGCSGRYQGTFHAGVIDGTGTFYLANGDRYEGDVRNGKMEGVGMLHLAHGNRYEGAFRDGAVEGLGVMYFANGGRYEGKFRNGQQDGLGTLYEANGTSYEGGFKADHPDGQAVVSYSSGDRYQGRYVDGHADGRGIYTKVNGERDVAIFKERRGELVLVSRIGPPLYKTCRDFCNASIAGCGRVVGTTSPLAPSGQATPGLDRYAQCANETSQCVESCREHNPTTGDIHGIIEIGAIQPGDGTPNKAPEESNGGGGSPDLTMEQAGATADLRASIERQRRELAQLNRQVVDRSQRAVAMQAAAAAAGKCLPEPRASVNP
jgi:hypothetical protein